MPEPEPDRRSIEIKRRPRYLEGILILFGIPIFLLRKIVWKYVQPVPFIISLVIISLIGWTWSSVLSINKWWIFPEQFLVGVRVLPFLPLEEFLFYPLGGFLVIFIYEFGNKTFRNKFYNRKSLISLIYLGTLLFFGAAIYSYPSQPYYLYSQFIVYNLLGLIFTYKIGETMNIYPLSLSTIAMGILGFFWDYFAFKYNWWIYVAITNIKIKNVPIDDFNFYFFAPLAAISIYMFIARFFENK